MTDGPAKATATVTDRPTAEAVPATATATALTTVRGPAPAPADALLRLDGLTVTDPGGAQLVSGVSFHINRGETFGLVGESGCGKSITASAILGLLPRGVTVASGSIRLQDTELAGLRGEKLRKVRGGRVGMVFQDPGSALSPVHTVGRQLTDAIRAHSDLNRNQATERAAELLNLVGVPAPRERLKDYPHQFSGGMAQRVVISRRAGLRPGAAHRGRADHRARRHHPGPGPRPARRTAGTAVDVAAADHPRPRCGGRQLRPDRRHVRFYQIAEQRTVRDAFATPRHPYTEALLAAVPHHGNGDEPLATIPGRSPRPGTGPRAAASTRAARTPPTPAAPHRCRSTSTGCAVCGPPNSTWQVPDERQGHGPRPGHHRPRAGRHGPAALRREPLRALPARPGHDGQAQAAHRRPGRQLHHRRRTHPRPGRGVRLRQEQHRAGHPAPRPGLRGTGPLRRPGHRRLRPAAPRPRSTGTCRSSSRTRCPR